MSKPKPSTVGASDTPSARASLPPVDTNPPWRPVGEDLMPRVRMPNTVIDDIVAAGVVKDECEGEDLFTLRLVSTKSGAWQVFKRWACSLGNAFLLVRTLHARSEPNAIYPPNGMGYRVDSEARTIVTNMAHLMPSNVANGIPEFPDPLKRWRNLVNVENAEVAVTAVVEAISNPSPRFPLIRALEPGTYICHLLYTWRAGLVIVPIYRE
ncbi:hypothetical protein AaE_001958 [Aphanomyces astaci]|uniref:Uncharacterized protein n=1 Tax=Aphanomyces astaci TaxID=112090 RepID=A0A6A5AVQ1_APHAT|nr:hypothetical protein AaE_001958 [Aphanomyces astaci]